MMWSENVFRAPEHWSVRAEAGAANEGRSLLIFFFFASFVGWLWEAGVYWYLQGFHVSPLTLLTDYRGVLHGFWVPIYGVGAVGMVVLHRFNAHWTPRRFMGVCMLLCGGLEYAVSWALEAAFGARWWDYSDVFLNLNGRISLWSVLFFGLAGVMVAYVAEPAFRRYTQRQPQCLQNGLCLVLTLCFLLDAGTSLFSPNMGMGVQLM